MRRIVKNLTFKVQSSQFLNRGFVVLTIDNTKPEIRSLLRWNPITAKADYKVKLIDSHTKETMRHSLTRVEISPDKQWVIAYWNPFEAIEALTDMLPTLITSVVIMGAISKINKGVEDGR